MWIVVAYDVRTDEAKGRKRLRRVAQVCKDFGQRVQKSIFECQVDDMKSAVLGSTVAPLSDEGRGLKQIHAITDGLLQK